MKLSTMNRLFIGALILAHVVLTSCEKNPAQPQQKAPSVPPESSMKIDLKAFHAAAAAGKAEGNTAAVGLNFLTARATVTLINASVALVLSVPVYVLAAALTQQPALDPSDGKFHWIIADEKKLFKRIWRGGSIKRHWNLIGKCASPQPATTRL